MKADLQIPKIKSFKVGTDELNVDELLKRDYDDVREASQVLPAAMAWLGYQRAYFQEQLYIAETAVKDKRGQLYLYFRENGLTETGFNGKTTEGAIESAVNVHPELEEAHKAVAKYTRLVSYLTAYIFAFERKIELVRTGEATHRRAVEHEPPSDEELENRRLEKTGDQ